MNIIKNLIAQLREDSKLCYEMCGVYPGDPSGDLSVNAYLLDKAASMLDRLDWEDEEVLFRKSQPEVVITYG